MLANMYLRIALLGLLVTGCSEASPIPPAGGTLAVGTWGGDNAGVIVTDSVTHVHIACTFGDIAGEIRLDGDGRFTATGTYVLRAYPVVVGPPVPARFSGRVSGSRLTLTVEVNDTVGDTVVRQGPITVAYGREPQMEMCPICRTLTRQP